MQNNLSIRPLNKEHQALLRSWLCDPSVLQFYGGRDKSYTMEMIEDKFYTNNALISRCIIYCNEIPIGYLQYYPINSCTSNLMPLVGSSAYGMDQFIGEGNYRNRGIGTELIKKVTAFLIEAYGASKVVLDPHVENVRAVACYEKAGFQRVKKLLHYAFHEGKYHDCWLLTYDTDKKVHRS
ncbi:GNAT family N-acetyltransferase [Virgibacillus chiguensis]|uniref:Aminoglycoside 6'-N-acetyltransferase n=1 Tax=Virgibacillus chiguensis TaxID=411959 RepID=A0A1M5TIR7_9BACI|nr:GNAT family N-acetyltransferase [Virgibacillus chiguensis]SHH50662.1 aminoglycoside 6'-N-acetyltransferase [Virgibacillus chiguensis]